MPTLHISATEGPGQYTAIVAMRYEDDGNAVCAGAYARIHLETLSRVLRKDTMYNAMRELVKDGGADVASLYSLVDGSVRMGCDVFVFNKRVRNDSIMWPPRERCPVVYIRVVPKEEVEPRHMRDYLREGHHIQVVSGVLRCWLPANDEFSGMLNSHPDNIYPYVASRAGDELAAKRMLDAAIYNDSIVDIEGAMFRASRLPTTSATIFRPGVQNDRSLPIFVSTPTPTTEEPMSTIETALKPICNISGLAYRGKKDLLVAKSTAAGASRTYVYPAGSSHNEVRKNYIRLTQMKYDDTRVMLLSSYERKFERA